MPKTLLIESQYLGSIHYFARLLHHGQVLIEKQEHYMKASYRNRCYIAMPTGKLLLSVPLQKGRNKQRRRCMKNVKIAYSYKWRKQHWKSLAAAYRSSPYFEFYEDDFEPFFQKKYTYLFDLNEELTHLILGLLQADVQINYTQAFEKQYDDKKYLDFRSAILPSPKKQQIDSLFTPPTYQQVFENYTGFLPNLSIVDLLFAEGPNASMFLKLINQQ